MLPQTALWTHCNIQCTWVKHRHLFWVHLCYRELFNNSTFVKELHSPFKATTLRVCLIDYKVCLMQTCTSGRTQGLCCYVNESWGGVRPWNLGEGSIGPLCCHGKRCHGEAISLLQCCHDSRKEGLVLIEVYREKVRNYDFSFCILFPHWSCPIFLLT